VVKTLMRPPLRFGCFLVPASSELSQEVLRLQRFRLSHLFSQPLQLGKLLEEIGRMLMQKHSLYFGSSVKAQGQQKVQRCVFGKRPLNGA
jgi:hypothetical protein